MFVRLNALRYSPPLVDQVSYKFAACDKRHKQCTRYVLIGGEFPEIPFSLEPLGLGVGGSGSNARFGGRAK